MSEKVDNYLRLLSARFLLFMAALILLMFLGNLRARYLYNALNLSYLLLSSCVYCFLAGIGLLRLKKWALLLLFLPGVLFIAVYAYGGILGARVPMPWALINYAFLAVVIGFPVYMLRCWHTFHWR
jgi:hypothetical protein